MPETFYQQIRNLLDVLIVSYLVYRVLLLVRGTRAVPMLFGLAVLATLFFISKWFGLVTLDWILGNFLSSIIIVVVVLFQDEIRRGLTKVGLQRVLRRQEKNIYEKALDDIILTAAKLSRAKLGALIVIQQNVGLDDLIEDAVHLDALVNRKLLYSMFVKDSPLHDGAVLIDGDRIKAAGCVLPLSFDPELDPNLGTRHRAALGISARSDCLVVVVSEETGSISLVKDERIKRNLDQNALRDALFKIFAIKSHDEYKDKEQKGKEKIGVSPQTKTDDKVIGDKR